MAVSAGSHVVNTILSYTIFAQIEAAPCLVAALELMLHLSGPPKIVATVSIRANTALSYLLSCGVFIHT